MKMRCIGIVFFIVVFNIPLWGVENANTSLFLLYYLRSGPTINLDTRGNVSIRRIEYSDYKNKVVRRGDVEEGTEEYRLFLFESGVFCGTDAVYKKGNIIQKHKEEEILYHSDGSLTINQYRVGSNQLIPLEYQWRNGVLIANDGKPTGRGLAVLEKNNAQYFYYSSYKQYQNDQPDTVISFDNEQVIITAYNSFPGEIFSISYFVKGILIKRENHRFGLTETYTTQAGTGEVVVTKDGKVSEIRQLERRKNEDGFLVYERVEYANGEAHEIYITAE
jgi:hypothetical protein